MANWQCQSYFVSMLHNGVDSFGPPRVLLLRPRPQPDPVGDSLPVSDFRRFGKCWYLYRFWIFIFDLYFLAFQSWFSSSTCIFSSPWPSLFVLFLYCCTAHHLPQSKRYSSAHRPTLETFCFTKMGLTLAMLESHPSNLRPEQSGTIKGYLLARYSLSKAIDRIAIPIETLCDRGHENQTESALKSLWATFEADIVPQIQHSRDNSRLAQLLVSLKNRPSPPGKARIVDRQ